MLGNDFYAWYQKNPNEATITLITMICIVIFLFSVRVYLKHKEEKRRMRERLMEEQFKRKYNIR